jgi:hypothetical protein
MSKNKPKKSKQKFKTKEYPLKKYTVVIPKGRLAIEVAREYLRCPFCKKSLNPEWICVPCGIYISFQT